MGLWSTIKESLGLVPPLRVAEPGPFAPTPRAEKRLRALSGATIRVATEAEGEGRRVIVQELSVPPPPGSALPLMIADHDHEHLRGLRLDHDGAAWVLALDLDVRASETPNPDVRLYELSRPVIVGRPLHVADPERAPALARRLLARPGVATLLLRENAVSVERQPGTAWAVVDRDVKAALRDYFLACGQAITQAEVGRGDDPAWSAVAAVMQAQVLPYVHQHGGDIQLIDVVDGVVTVALHGACASCPASMLTLRGGVQRHLREALPDLVQRVEAVTAP